MANSPTPETQGKDRLRIPTEKRKKAFWRRGKVLLLSPLLLLALLLSLNWCSLSLVRAPNTTATGTALSWREQFGEPEPSAPDSIITPAPAPLATHLMPEVLSVEDAVEWEGGWVLLDRRLGRLHFVGIQEGLARSLGGKGQGPGELLDPVALALADTLLWVLNRRGLLLDRFDEDTGFVERREIRGGGCLVGLAKKIVSLGSGPPLLLRFCPPSLPGPGTVWVEQLSEEGWLTPILSLRLGDAGSRRLHLAREPVLTGGVGSFFLGTWDAPCLAEFDAKGRPLGRRCVPTYPRPRTDDSQKNRLETRFRSIEKLGLLPLEVPDHLPWYDGAFATTRGLVVRRIRSPEERDLVLLLSDGGSIRLDHIFPTNTFVGEETILATQDLLQGTRVDIFPNPWR